MFLVRSDSTDGRLVSPSTVHARALRAARRAPEPAPAYWGHGENHVLPHLSHPPAGGCYRLLAVPPRPVGIRAGALSEPSDALTRTISLPSDLGALRGPSFFPTVEGGEFSSRWTVRTNAAFSPGLPGCPCVLSLCLSTIIHSFDGCDSLSTAARTSFSGPGNWRSSTGPFRLGPSPA